MSQMVVEWLGGPADGQQVALRDEQPYVVIEEFDASAVHVKDDWQEDLVNLTQTFVPVRRIKGVLYLVWKDRWS